MFTLTVATDKGTQAQRVFINDIQEFEALLVKTLGSLQTFRKFIGITDREVGMVANLKSLISQAK